MTEKQWSSFPLIEVTFIRIYITMICNNIVIFIDVEWIKYIHIMMPKGCSFRGVWCCFDTFQELIITINMVKWKEEYFYTKSAEEVSIR